MKILLSLMIVLSLVLTGCYYEEDEPAFVTLTDSGVTLADNATVIIQGRTGEETYQTPYLDSDTHTIQTIEYEHSAVHAGNSFSCWYEQTVSDIGDKSIITFRTANTDKWMHLTITVSATTDAHGNLIEAPKVTDNTGNTTTVFNRDRNSANAAGLFDTSTNPDTQGQATFFDETTMGNVTGGTDIAAIHLGLGEKKTLGGTGRGSQEWILLPNTLYAIIIESTTAEDNNHLIKLNWYELENLEP